MADLTIRGAGIFGLAIAWTCVARGARVQIIDPFGPGSGASGGVVGALAPHVPENWNAKKQFQLESLLMAKAFWEDVSSAGGVSTGYARSGRLQPVADDHVLALARTRVEGAQHHWGAHATWRVTPAATDTWAPPTPSGWLIHDTLSALVHPRQACDALAAALRARGVTVATDGTDQGAVVWATGVAGLAALSIDRDRPVGAGVKGQAAVLDHDARGQPQVFADGLHIIPHLDGTVAIGSTSERDFETPDKTDGDLDALLAHARQAMPVLADAPVLARWAGVRPRSRSRAPMLGPWPERAGHFVANGGFKIGFGMAPKVAEVMADLLLDGKDVIPADFRVEASF